MDDQFDFKLMLLSAATIAILTASLKLSLLSEVDTANHTNNFKFALEHINIYYRILIVVCLIFIASVADKLAGTDTDD